MYGALIFAGLIALFGFLAGAIGSIFATKASLLERLFMALGVAAATFLASLILIWRDYGRHTAALQSVRERLLARDDMDDAEFLAPLLDSEPELLLEIRRATAQIFEVPPTKIYPTDRPDDDFQFAAMAPMPYFFIIGRLLTARELESEEVVMADPKRFTDFRKLGLEMRRIIDECEGGKSAGDETA